MSFSTKLSNLNVSQDPSSKYSDASTQTEEEVLRNIEPERAEGSTGFVMKNGRLVLAWGKNVSD